MIKRRLLFIELTKVFLAFALLLYVTTGLVASATAQTVTVAPVAGTDPFVPFARQTTYSRSVTLLSPDVEGDVQMHVEQISFREGDSDLNIHQAGDTTGPKADIVPTPIKLEKTKPATVRINFTNITRPGVYVATFRLSQSEKTLTVSTTEVILDVRAATPVIAPQAGAATAFTVVRPSWNMNVGDVPFLLPASLRGNTRTLLLENKTPGSVYFKSQPAMTLRSERTGRDYSRSLPTVNDGPWGKPNLPPLNEALNLNLLPVPFAVERSSLPAGRYNGRVELGIAGAAPFQGASAFTVDVRDGWIWPLILLLCGLFLGSVTQLANTPLARMQEDLFGRYFILRREVETYFDPLTVSYLLTKLADVRRTIELAASETERTAIEASLSTITGFIKIFEALADAKAAVQSHGTLLEPEKQAFILQLNEAVSKVIAGQLADAQTMLDAVNAALNAPPVASLVAGDISTAAAAAARVSVKALAAANTKFAVGLVQTNPATARKTPSFSSFAFRSAEWRYLYLRPLLVWLLISAALMVGFDTLYINDPTFGVNGLYDYGKCFLWGVGADVVSKTLQTLNLPKLTPGG